MYRYCRRVVLAMTSFAILSTPLVFEPGTLQAGIASQNRPCWKAYREWKNKKRHKAFAVTAVGTGQTCGAVWGAGSKAIAEREAIKVCAKGKWGVGATCYIMESQ